MNRTPLNSIKDLPNLAGFERKNAEALMEAKDVDYKFTGHGSIVRNVTMKNEKIVLECGPTEIEMDKMPKLTGISLREAMSKIDHSKILVRIEGSGLVKKTKYFTRHTNYQANRALTDL